MVTARASASAFAAAAAAKGGAMRWDPTAQLPVPLKNSPAGVDVRGETPRGSAGSLVAPRWNTPPPRYRRFGDALSVARLARLHTQRPRDGATLCLLVPGRKRRRASAVARCLPPRPAAPAGSRAPGRVAAAAAFAPASARSPPYRAPPASRLPSARSRAGLAVHARPAGAPRVQACWRRCAHPTRRRTRSRPSSLLLSG
mmetsp:Transcript_16165/g.39750  ORF Transcript_16165/g.39750 Transcript_16165/m.39750 type:complete len:200 (-) Transcript_16165:185-784(-)